MNELSATVVMWRCTTCGKWSHAVRRPTTHQRWVRFGEPGYDLAEDEATPADEDYVGHAARCGPFERWVATRG